MAPGDVTVEIVEDVTTAKLDTAITALRISVGAAGKILMESIHTGQDMMIVGIEEA